MELHRNPQQQTVIYRTMLRDDSIAQFVSAARLRNEDAWALVREGRGAAAVYLWGYVGEMVLKAAWFRLTGFAENDPIEMRHLREAQKLAVQSYGILWPGNLHCLPPWAELLVQHRIFLRRQYSVGGVAQELVEHSRRIYSRWREIMRYKSNRPYRFELRTVCESAEWLLFHWPAL